MSGFPGTVPPQQFTPAVTPLTRRPTSSRRSGPPVVARPTGPSRLVPSARPQLAAGATAMLRRATEAIVDTVVPAPLIAPMKRALGIDLSDVRVRRGGEVSLAARYLGARAYTAAEVVHLPDSAGPLESGDAAPLLAHELTHAAQQRRFGAALPGPETAAGRRLEAEAVIVQEWVAGGTIGEPPVVRGHAPVQLACRDHEDLGHEDLGYGELDDEPEDDFDEDVDESDLDKARRRKRLRRQVERDESSGEGGFETGWDEIPDLAAMIERRRRSGREPEGWHEVPDVLTPGHPRAGRPDADGIRPTAWR